MNLVDDLESKAKIIYPTEWEYTVFLCDVDLFYKELTDLGIDNSEFIYSKNRGKYSSYKIKKMVVSQLDRDAFYSLLKELKSSTMVI